jgi:hypothetical protein
MNYIQHHINDGEEVKVEGWLVDKDVSAAFPVLEFRTPDCRVVTTYFFKTKADVFRFANSVARAAANLRSSSETEVEGDDPDPQERGEQIRDEAVDAALCETPPIVQAIRSVEEIFDHARAGFEEVALEEEKVE